MLIERNTTKTLKHVLALWVLRGSPWGLGALVAKLEKPNNKSNLKIAGKRNT